MIRKSTRISAATLALAIGAISLPAAVDAAGHLPIPAEGIDLDVVIPASKSISVNNAQFRWGLNQEATSGAHFGGCNFLSAGAAGDAGGSRVWTSADPFYSASTGSVRIEKPNAKGAWSKDSWTTKCQESTGRTVGTSVNEPGTGAQAVIDSGTGTIDAAKGRAEIRWKGSFTVAMYGGMTYWSVTDPVLKVSDGKGTLTATLSGFASDRMDTSVWKEISPRSVTIANLPNIALGEKGIIASPAYLKVKTEGVDPAQVRTESNWGAFPQAFIDFHSHTGQAAYWYSSGSMRDGAKVASPLAISYSATAPVLPKPPKNEPITPPVEPEPGNKGSIDVPGGGGNQNPPVGGSVIAGAAIPQSLEPQGTVIAGDQVPGIVRTAGTSTAQAVQWLGESLIPQAAQLARNHRDALLWSLSGLLALSSISWVGFRRGWLRLPWSK